MKKRTCARILALSAAAALILPAASWGHPGVYTVTAKIAKTAARQTVGDDATGGNWKPSAAASVVAFDATAAEVQSALEADPSIGYDNVRVSGPEVSATARSYSLEFVGTLAGTAVATVVPSNVSLTGGASSVSSSSTQTGGASVTYGSDPTGASMANQEQFVVSSDGYAIGFKETNGVGPGGGILNLKELPSAYRASMTSLQKLAYPGAQTGIQLHATCSGVAALSEPANILLAWDVAGRADGDPFYDYIPWQPTSAGLGDEPSKWIPVVKTLTGVDLSKLTTPAELSAACSGIGGTYHPADTASNITTAVVADAVEAATTPLNEKISAFTVQLESLGSQITALTSEKASLGAANGSLTAANAALNAQLAQRAPAVQRPLRITLANSKLSAREATAMVTGEAGETVGVSIQLSAATAKVLHLKTRTAAMATRKLNDQGAGLFTLAASRSVARAITRARNAVPVTVAATAGSRRATATATLVG